MAEFPNKDTQFSSERQPKKNGRTKGSRNRQTIVNKWLEVILDTKNQITGENEALPIADQMVLALIDKALKGDVSAFKELMDSGYGKLTEKVEHSGELITGFEITVKNNDPKD